MYQKFISLKNTTYYSQEKAYVNKALQYKGIIVIGKIIGRKPYKKNILAIKINFKRLIEQKNHMELFNEQDLKQVADTFDFLLNNLCDGMPNFYNWKVNRIDYCLNIKTPYVKEYIELLQKSDKPFSVHIKPDNNRNYTQKKGSLYLVGKSITINFYDKQDQLIKEQIVNTNITDKHIQQAKDILRLEVQCHKPRTEYLKTKYNMTAKNIHYFLDAKISFNVLETILLKVTRKGDYLRKSIAIDKINKSAYKEKTKDGLIQIINDIATQHQSIWKVRDKYINLKLMSKDTFSRYLRKLDTMNINAVTISDKKSIRDKHLNEGLLNLYDLFYYSFMQKLYIDDIEILDSKDI